MGNQDEKSVPTKQDQEKKISRVQSKNGNKGRKKNFSQTSSDRSQAPISLTKENFSKSFRMRKRREFLALRKVSRRFYGSCIAIDYAQKSIQAPKVGITVSKKFGNACLRNRFKRCVREAFRKSKSDIPSTLIMQVCPLSKKERITCDAVKNDLQRLVKKIEKD